MAKSSKTVREKAVAVLAEPTPALDLAAVGPSRPSLGDLMNAKTVEVSTVIKSSVGVWVAGLWVTSEPREYSLSQVRFLGINYLRALAQDDQIVVRIVE